MHIGDDVFIGEKTALDIESSVGDGAQLGHTSSVHSGQHIPAGQRWHGVPAEPTSVDYRVIPGRRRGGVRRFVYGTLQLLTALTVFPLISAAVVAAASLPAVAPVVQGVLGDGHGMLLSPAFYGWIAAITARAVPARHPAGLLAMIILPRLLSVFVRPGAVHPLYGVRWIAAQTITRLGNSEFYMTMFGDSSVVVHYLRAIGYRMPRLEQTGSNFGTELKQDAALLTTIGSGTMVSDSLSVMNADFSADSFRMSPIAIGAHCFVGNNIAYPADARIGQNVLLGSKVMVPMDGPVRHDVGLLGSPCFEIPRTVAPARRRAVRRPRSPPRETPPTGPEEPRTTPSPSPSSCWRGCSRTPWRSAVVLAMPFHPRFGEWAFTGGLLSVALFMLTSRSCSNALRWSFRALRPRQLTMYERSFWRHERLWKLFTTRRCPVPPGRTSSRAWPACASGADSSTTGASCPRRVWLPSATIGPQRRHRAPGPLARGRRLHVRPHPVSAGDLALGVGAFVHHGTVIGEDCLLDADSFLVKGEHMPDGSVWGGNPAALRRTATR